MLPGGEICSKNREIILLVLLTTQPIETVSVWDPQTPLQNFKKMWIPRIHISLGHSLKRLRERERERGVPVLALTGTRNAEREQVSPPQAPIFWALKDTFFKS